MWISEASLKFQASQGYTVRPCLEKKGGGGRVMTVNTWIRLGFEAITSKGP